eukprot:1129821-Pyramimonas_sp.AAC.1
MSLSQNELELDFSSELLALGSGQNPKSEETALPDTLPGRASCCGERAGGKPSTFVTAGGL